MRAVTRNLVVGLLLVLVALLALGALPGLLGSGDPYYLAAEAVEDDADRETVNATGLSERRFPYTTAALETGRSDAYYDEPTGLKEAFTHTPSDELAEFEARNPDAVEGDVAFVTRNDTTYRLELVREGDR